MGAVVAATLLIGRRWTLVALLLAAAVALGQPGLAAMERASLAWRWPGQTIQASAYTRHGHVAVLAQGDQRNLFEDGHLSLVLPDRQPSEELVHLALLQMREPRRIFVAQGLGGLLPQILKHPVDEVIMAEPEATLAKMEIAAADPATRQALTDPRVHLVTGDTRRLLRKVDSQIDILLLNPAEPSTLLAARLLTRECFAEVRRALRPGGVLAFALPGAENYYSPELVARNGSIWKALAATFAHVAVTPLSTNYFLASDAWMSLDPVELARRLDERKVKANFVDQYALAALMPEERVQNLVRQYQEAPVGASSDRLPSAYLHSLLVLGQADAGRIAGWLRWALRLNFWTLALGLAACMLLPALLFGRARRAHVPGLLVVSALGFASMASTILILMVTQSVFGALHHLMGLLLAANMAGLALAAWAPGWRWQAWGAVGLGLVVPALLPLLARVSTHVPAWVVLGALLIASLAAGAAVGMAFRAALLRGTSPGVTYATDLFGAALAAPTVAAIVLPGFGLDASCALIALLLAPAALALLSPPTTCLPR
jgi:spermidine synthase